MDRVATVERVGLPPASRLRASYGRAGFADAFAVDLPDTAPDDPEGLARAVLSRQPAWIAMLLRIRDVLVRPFGLKTAGRLRAEAGDRLDIFRVFERYPDEIVLGEDDSHLDFRVSVLVEPAAAGRSRRLTLTTLVFYNRPLGRAYIALIAPFHRMVVRSSLDRALKDGWPGAGQPAL